MAYLKLYKHRELEDVPGKLLQGMRSVSHEKENCTEKCVSCYRTERIVCFLDRERETMRIRLVRIQRKPVGIVRIVNCRKCKI